MTGAEVLGRVGDPILCDRHERTWTLTLNRIHRRNSIDPMLVDAISRVLDDAERDPQCKMIVIQGRDGIFCTGLDFESVPAPQGGGTSATQGIIGNYMELMVRLASISKIVVAKVEGIVLAGGVGWAAASDLVIATRSSYFSLSEALWGLLPACVAPFLIRRVGFQNAYRMTFTTETVRADQARTMGLVDILTDDPDDEIRRQLLRIARVDERTVGDIKRYYKRFWNIDRDTIEAAVEETSRLLGTNRVRENIANYVATKTFPWER